MAACLTVTYPAEQPTPDLVAVAADWHGDTEWAVRTVYQAADAGAAGVVQLGDFGLWPGNGRFLVRLEQACRRLGLWLWWLPGNHEHWPTLREWEATAGAGRAFQVRPDVWYLPRGYRWTWHGRTWMALGGAVSPDRAHRSPGHDWFPDEALSDVDVAAAAAGGPVDILLTHDSPAMVPVTFPPAPTFWRLEDLAAADRHREQLQRAVDAVRPAMIMHGHLHMAFAKQVSAPWGPVEVVSLDCNHGDGPHWVLVNTRTGTWQPPAHLLWS